MVRRWHAAVLAVLAAFALACEGTGQAGGSDPDPDRPPQTGLPSSMAALGDSITAGYGSCIALVVCGRNSWATGLNPDVRSHYLRILRDNSAIRGRRHNLATPGARAAGLRAQADAAVRARVAYVTVLIGANDVCRAGSVAGMTDPADFRAQLDAALDRLASGLPRARIVVVSIPDLYRLWEVGHTDDGAVRAWGRGICPVLLARPRSTAAADERRRRDVDRRVTAYNRALAGACRAHRDQCRYDEGAAHRVRFTLAMVNRLDYFHPNAAGQARLAEETFPRRFAR
ncbi:MAG TPA: SGNH/GDSL hydrolase family protein [Pilimelia sp.]|nr:SGNH/GDSL hydrolase family protein [Pilimelia sp.]